jgi:Fe-S-cluster containining protein
MIRGQINTHATLSEISERINDIEAFVFGINDALIEKGILPSRFLFKKIEKVKKEMMEHGESLHANIALRVDSENYPESQVNCLERLHICKGICCKLSFPLSDEEVESGKIKWDLGRPYYIRQNEDGFCCSRGEEGKCNIYLNRPRVCRTYTCEGDERIWKDFEKMELNEEWINSNLTGGYPK